MFQCNTPVKFQCNTPVTFQCNTTVMFQNNTTDTFQCYTTATCQCNTTARFQCNTTVTSCELVSSIRFKLACAFSEDSISLYVYSILGVLGFRLTKCCTLAYPYSAHRRLADAQADLCRRWPHMPTSTICW